MNMRMESLHSTARAEAWLRADQYLRFTNGLSGITEDRIQLILTLRDLIKEVESAVSKQGADLENVEIDRMILTCEIMDMALAQSEVQT